MHDATIINQLGLFSVPKEISIIKKHVEKHQKYHSSIISYALESQKEAARETNKIHKTGTEFLANINSNAASSITNNHQPFSINEDVSNLFSSQYNGKGLTALIKWGAGARIDTRNANKILKSSLHGAILNIAAVNSKIGTYSLRIPKNDLVENLGARIPRTPNKAISEKIAEKLVTALTAHIKNGNSVLVEGGTLRLVGEDLWLDLSAKPHRFDSPSTILASSNRGSTVSKQSKAASNLVSA